MKKKYLIGLCLLALLVLTSCDKVVTHEGGVEITVPAVLKPYLVYEGELPKMFFEYEGTVNVADFSVSNRMIFAKNDFYHFSDQFAKHMAKVDENSLITSSVNQEGDYKEARFGGDKLLIDTPDEYSQEVMKVSWDETGTRYSYLYRTFVSDGKRYYVSTYANNVMMTMEMPLLVSNKTGTNRIYLLSLPYDTKYEVSGNLKIDSLVEKDTYLDENYYKFFYPAYMNRVANVATKIEMVKEWYIMYCNGKEENGQFTFEYLGNKFAIDFTIKTSDIDGFQIILL